MPQRPAPVGYPGGGGAPTIPHTPTGAPGLREIGLECTGEGYAYLDKGMTPGAVAQGHNPPPTRGRPSRAKVEAAMSEVFSNPPSTVAPNQTPADRRRQMQAIAFSKARRGR